MSTTRADEEEDTSGWNGKPRGVSGGRERNCSERNSAAAVNRAPEYLTSAICLVMTDVPICSNAANLRGSATLLPEKSRLRPISMPAPLTGGEPNGWAHVPHQLNVSCSCKTHPLLNQMRSPTRNFGSFTLPTLSSTLWRVRPSLASLPCLSAEQVV